jgi:hypothetical protein
MRASWRSPGEQLVVFLWTLPCALLLGALAATGRGLALAAAAGGGLALAALGRWRRGATTALLVLAALNGIPFINLTHPASDVILPVLAGWLAWCNLGQPLAPRLAQFRRRAAIWSMVFIGWWLIVLARSVLIGGIPITNAATYGYDFLAFAVLLPLMVGALRNREDALGAVTVLAVGAVVFSTAEIAGQLAGVNPSAFVHPSQIRQTAGGFLRYYTQTSDAVIAVVMFGTGLAFLGQARWVRLAGAGLAAVGATATVLQFVRAVFIGAGIGFVAGTAVWALSSSPVSRRLRRVGLVAVAGTLAIAATLQLAQVGPQRGSRVSLAIAHVEASRQEVTQGSGSGGYRYRLDRSLLRVLGNQWPVGLGFDPTVRPLSGLSSGEIRSPDSGPLNVLMTMGAIGLVLLYMPVVVAVSAIAGPSSRRAGRPDHAWLRYGVSVWLLAELVGSLTLATLFSPAGLGLAALVIALGLAATALDAPAPRLPVR